MATSALLAAFAHPAPWFAMVVLAERAIAAWLAFRRTREVERARSARLTVALSSVDPEGRMGIIEACATFERNCRPPEPRSRSTDRGCPGAWRPERRRG